MKIVIDTNLCTGHGRCFSLVPELFVDDENGYGQAKGDGTVPPGLEAEARRAEGACPERAISLVD